jgi:6-phosphogluconolactonase (cycloisomerase 2 family)
MKNSVHDNGGFIGRVADYAATDYYQTSGVYSAYSFTFDNITFGVGSQASESRGLFFKPDGTMIFIVDNGGDNVYSYSLTTAWDLSTASYTGDSFSVSSQTSRASDIYFKPDGTKLYVSGQLINGLSEYSLSTAWDITTASFSSGTGEFSEGLGVMGLTFKPDGTQFYVSNFHNDYVHVYSMTTAWDISTHSFSGDEFSLLSQVGSPTDIAFNSDGTVMYAVGESNYFASWDLSTAYDVTTATFNSKFSVTSNTRGISFKSDYSKLYLVEYTNDTVRQYSASVSLNGNKKNTGVWSMDADYLNAEVATSSFDIDTVYGTTYLRELTSFPSATFTSGSGGSGQVDVTFIIDMTFSTTDTGCILDQGGLVDGTYVGMVSGGNLRLSTSGAVSGASNETSTTTTDMSAYAGVAGQLIVTIDYQNHIQCWWNDSTNGINQIVSVDFNGNGDWAGGNVAMVGQGSGSVHGGQTLSAFTGTITRYREITTYVDTSTF